MSERTKKDILAAYNGLIRKIDMDKLSVEMIANEAGISRATFYRHFKDKYDVMNYNYKLLLDELSDPKNSSSYQDLYEKLYRHGRTKLKFLRKAFNTQGINSLIDYIATYSQEIAEEITRQNRGGNGFTETERLQFDVYTIGIATMYKRWIFDQYNLTSEEAAKALYEMMPESLRDMWWVE